MKSGTLQWNLVPAGLFNLVLNFFCMINIQWKKVYLGDVAKNVLNISLHSEVSERIS